MPRPSRLDVLIVAALAAWALLEALLLAGDGSRPERVAWALAFTLPLLGRRHAPTPVAAFLAAAVVVRVVLDQGGPGEEGAMPFPAVLVMIFSAAVHARTLALAAAGGIVLSTAIVLVIALSYFTGDPQPSDGAILTFFCAAAWGAGFFVRRRTTGGEVQAREAVAAERARISRDLHDIIGHSMSVIALQAGAAEQLLRRDPDRAEQHLRAVQDTAREGLAEMRRLMGVLREDEATYAPQPGLDALDGLVEQARATGLEVEVSREGEPASLAPGVDLAAYRIVQEALTNARKHAGPVRARVAVRFAPGAVDLEVRNAPGAGAALLNGGGGGGQGLIGMAERARLFGGTLEHGREPDGGFRVHARLPVAEAAR